MKSALKYLNYLIIGLIAIGPSLANKTILSPENMSMGFIDEKNTEFCITDKDNAVDAEILIDNMCKDLNGIPGCSNGDLPFPAEFAAMPAENRTGADGCANIRIKTNAKNNETGIYYYSANGFLAKVKVGPETDYASVPEMGFPALLAILMVAGLFVAGRRRA